MLNLSVSVAVLMLEALLIKTWSQLGLNMSASLLLRRDQEGFPQKEKEMVRQQPRRMSCVLGKMWPSRFYLWKERNYSLPCPMLRGFNRAVGTRSNPMGGFPFPF